MVLLEGLLLDPANSFLVQLWSKAPPNTKVKEAQGDFSDDFPMCFNGKTKGSTRPTKTFPANSHPFLSQATLPGRYYQTDPVWARGSFGAAKSSCCKLFFCKMISLSTSCHQSVREKPGRWEHQIDEEANSHGTLFVLTYPFLVGLWSVPRNHLAKITIHTHLTWDGKG